MAILLLCISFLGSTESSGGEGGIRTLGTLGAHYFSRVAPSTTRSPLHRDHFNRLADCFLALSKHFAHFLDAGDAGFKSFGTFDPLHIFFSVCIG